jgi:hypothetical protein
MRWISMLAPSKRVFEEYKTLVVKMINDVISNVITNINY